MFSGVGLLYPFKVGNKVGPDGLPTTVSCVDEEWPDVFVSEDRLEGANAPQPVYRIAVASDARDGMPRQFQGGVLDDAMLRPIPAGAVPGIQDAMKHWKVDSYFPHFMKLPFIRTREKLDVVGIRTAKVEEVFKKVFPEGTEKNQATLDLFSSELTKSLSELGLQFAYSGNATIVQAYRTAFPKSRFGDVVPLADPAFVKSFLSELSYANQGVVNKMCVEAVLVRIFGETRQHLEYATESGRNALPQTVDYKVHEELQRDRDNLKRRLESAHEEMTELRKRVSILSRNADRNVAELNNNGVLVMKEIGDVWAFGPRSEAHNECAMVLAQSEGDSNPNFVSLGKTPIRLHFHTWGGSSQPQPLCSSPSVPVDKGEDETDKKGGP